MSSTSATVSGSGFASSPNPYIMCCRSFWKTPRLRLRVVAEASAPPPEWWWWWW
uniref:Uncharacterized protein n=1 Tax=Oryza brachyantha TaxID=4533 RepID=J3KZI2_ORYBR